VPRKPKAIEKPLHTLKSVTEWVEKLSEAEKGKTLIFLNDLKKVIKTTPVSDRTHYVDSDEFCKVVYNFIHESLKEAGFVNGDVEANKLMPFVQVIWWFYAEIMDHIYRITWPIPVAHHHASSKDRQRAMLYSLDSFAKAFNYDVSE
jgi:hypothetical protein